MWQKFKASFHDSETIVWARVKTFIGILFTAYTQAGLDISIFVENPKVVFGLKLLFAFLTVDGLMSEWARRRRDDFGETDAGNDPQSSN